MASPGFPLRAAADGPRRIGMPRALLHYRYGTLWTTFFEALGCDVVLSDPTDRSTVAHGDALSNDECCLASKDLPGTRGLAGGFGRVRCRVRAQHRQRGTTARVLHEVPGAARPRGQYLRRPAHRSTVRAW